MPSVYAYLDCREYLRDVFADKRARNPDYSYRAAAASLGINSGTLVRILNGQRGLTPGMAPRFVSYLKLREKEAEYFAALVAFGHARLAGQKRRHYEKLLRLRGERKTVIAPDRHEFYREWYHTALRELLGLGVNGADCRTLARLLIPSVSPAQVRKALDLLMRLGFVRRDPDGAFRVVEQQITTGETWSGTAVHQFQVAMMDLARNAIDSLPKEERDISTLTACFSKDGLLQAREVLARARQELLAIEELDAGRDRVYQVNFQVFPLSRSLKEGTP